MHVPKRLKNHKKKEKEYHSINHYDFDNRFGDGPNQNGEQSGENGYNESSKREYLGGSLGQGVVLLSDDELEDLQEKLSQAEFDKYVGIVAEKELKGHHYKKKTHYRAILDMAMMDRKKAR